MLGFENTSLIQYLIAFAVVMGLLALFAWLAPRLLGRRVGGQGLASGKAKQPRLGIVDVYDLDRQRQLVLLRRDGVEHLLLIGGPNDVVVETGIGRAPPRPMQRPGGAQAPAGPAQAPAGPAQAPAGAAQAPAGAPAPAPLAAAPPATPVPPQPPQPAVAGPIGEPVRAAEARAAYVPTPEEARDRSRVSDAAVAAQAPEVVLPEAPEAAAPTPPPAPEAPRPLTERPSLERPPLERPSPAAPARAAPPAPPTPPAPQPAVAPEPPPPPPRRGLMDLARAATGVATPSRSRATPTLPPEPAPDAPTRREPRFEGPPQRPAAPPSPPTPTPPAPPPRATPEPAAPEDAAVLSDMARQLEEALKRPLPPGAQPRRPASEATPAEAKSTARAAQREGAGSEFDFASLLRRPAEARGPQAGETQPAEPPPRAAGPIAPAPPIPPAPPPPVEAPAGPEPSPEPTPETPREPPAPEPARNERVEAERIAADAALARFGADEPSGEPVRTEPPRFSMEPEESLDTGPESPADAEIVPQAEPSAAEPEPVEVEPVEAAEPEAAEPEPVEPEPVEPEPEPEPEPVEPEREPEPEPAEPPALRRAQETAAAPPPAPEEAGAAEAEPDPEPEPEPETAREPEKPAAKPIDPFSVEEIEAEFARLLGRAPGSDNKT